MVSLRFAGLLLGCKSDPGFGCGVFAVRGGVCPFWHDRDMALTGPVSGVVFSQVCTGHPYRRPASHLDTWVL